MFNIDKQASIEALTRAELYNIAPALSCPQFAAYYAETRRFLPPALWFVREELPAGINASVSTWDCKSDGYIYHVMRLRRLPCEVADAPILAHEYDHLRLESEGYPGVASIHAVDTLASALGSLLQDPLICTHLAPFGFDLCPAMDSDESAYIQAIAQLPDTAFRRDDRILWTLNYIGIALEREAITGSAKPGPFARAFDARFPGIARQARKLLATVRSMGYATPAQQDRALIYLVKHFGLQNRVTLLRTVRKDVPRPAIATVAHGATWAAITGNPVTSSMGSEPGGGLHVPFHDNASDLILYWNRRTDDPSETNTFIRTNGATETNISPASNYGPRDKNAVSTDPLNRQRVLCTLNHETDDNYATFYSANGGDTWTQLTSAAAFGDTYNHCSISNDGSGPKGYLWGGGGRVGVTTDFATIDERGPGGSSAICGIAGG